MKILSVNTGRIQEISWRGSTLTTAFVKTPVTGSAEVGPLGVEGDIQADRRVHGGVDKAVYLYAREHYARWETELQTPLEPGALGENLTTEGVLEADLHIGDRLAVGTALLEVSQPRLPCVKLAARHGREDLPRLFTEAALPGVYLRVVEPGTVEAGARIRVVGRHPEAWGLIPVFRLLTSQREDRPTTCRLATLACLGQGARAAFQDRTGLRADVIEADADARARVGELLEAAGLPLGGFPGDTPVVLAAREEGRVVGGVALERWADAALLRSLVVDASARGRGLGLALTAAAMARARAAGASSVSLLTETAEAFFREVGFHPVPRQELPAALGRSEELRGACPDTAVALTLPLETAEPG